MVFIAIITVARWFLLGVQYEGGKSWEEIIIQTCGYLGI